MAELGNKWVAELADTDAGAGVGADVRVAAAASEPAEELADWPALDTPCLDTVPVSIATGVLRQANSGR